MREAFVQLLCPACTAAWEENPADLPPPEDGFACNRCGERRPVAEFMRNARDLEVLEEFHE